MEGTDPVNDSLRCFLCECQHCEASCPDCGAAYCSISHYESHRSKDQKCFPFRVDSDPRLGRHFVATRDIHPLEVVLQEPPGVVGPATKTTPVCLNCLRAAVPEGPRCKQCRFPMCGTRSCVNGRRNLHGEAECRILAATSLGETIRNFEDPNIIYACIFVLRIMQLRENDPGMFHRLTSMLTPGSIKDLVGSNFAKNATECLGKMETAVEITEEDFCMCLGIKRTNASDLSTVELDGGVALYPTYPLMNSHCFCNTRCSIDPETFWIEVRAIRPIKRGEQITTRYIELWEGQPFRSEKIWRHWKFSCNCQRCLDPTEFGTFYSAIKCQDCSSALKDGYLLPLAPRSDRHDPGPWKCNICSNMKSPSEVKTVLDQAEQTLSKTLGDLKTIATLQEAGNCLEVSVAAMLRLLHPNHFLVWKAKNFIHGIQYPSENDQEGLVSFLDLKLAYSSERLLIGQALDPGLTLHRASAFKTVAKTRMDLANARLKVALSLNGNESEAKAEHSRSMKKAMLELRQMCLSLKVST